MAIATDARKKTVTIEFVETGLTAFGNVWEAGQRKTIEKDSREWNTTVNRRGEDSWLLLGPKGQMARWGKIYFRKVQNADLTGETEGEGDRKDG